MKNPPAPHSAAPASTSPRRSVVCERRRRTGESLAVMALAVLFPWASLSAAPVISSVQPTSGALVGSLTSVQIIFSEAVGGLDATDLIINGAITQNVSGTGAGPYTFTFNQPQPGSVSVEFAGDSGIAGISGSGTFAAPPSWSYTLADTLAPTIQMQVPTPAAVAGVLTEAQVTFSEAVTGVDAADFKIDGVAAISVAGFGSGPYTFAFPQPAAGTVNFTWASGHGIVDTVGNAFAGAGWSVALSASGAGNAIINEFTAINSSTYLDADGDNEAWIEIYNPGPASVNLGGWALTDDPAVPGKWIFPSRTLASGAYLVVFASGKNRRPASGELHTNFKPGENSGDLSLVKPDRPLAFASHFVDYPGQRAGYSYGLSGGVGRYFTPPTPGAVNSATVLSAAAAPPVFSTIRGFFTTSFSLGLTTPTVGATIRYTTDGSEPTATTGTVYSIPFTIGATTVVRAAAFASGFVPSATVTNTYIFQAQVINQTNTPAGFPADWGTNVDFNGGVVPADYGMDLDPLRVTPTNSASALDPVKVQRYNDGLRELPSLLIALPNSSMFASTGMYHSSHVMDKDFAAQACSVEMILPDGATAFATTSGMGVHGNASREPQKNPKHGFKLKFKPEFGPGKLEYKLFPDTAVQEYDDIVVRAEFGTSWRHWSDSTGNANGASQRSRSTGIRDQWMKDTMLEMGGLASHSRLAHLFINGLYFGVYDLTEDPSSAFGENFLGGQKGDYDVYDQGVLAEGTSTVYKAMTVLPAATANSTYEQFKGYLDMPSFIDYMLLHFYVGHQDWGLNKNWSAIRQRAGGTFTTEGKFRYIPWDLENILLNTDVNRVPASSGGSTDVPSSLHTKLDDNPQYRLDFADHIHRRMIAPGGVLTPAKNTVRWQKWQTILDKPIVAESCRWGDYRRDVHRYAEGSYALYTRESQWLAENSRITGTYFPTRPTTVMAQFRQAQLYPTLNAAEFRNSGVAVGSGLVTTGYQITMAFPTAESGTTSAGTIYYTTDGTDPRVIYSGAVSSGALAYTTTPLTISTTTTVKARVLNGTTWSALNEATFATDAALPLVKITELMYHPVAGETYEFLELFNAGDRTVDLNGWSFTGITYVFPPGATLAPGSRLVLASNDSPAGWRTNYPGITPAAYYAGALSNGGETITLLNKAGDAICSVNFKDKAPWPVTPDGGGYSLEVIDPLGDLNDPENWQASTALNGSPGTPNSPPAAPVITAHPASQTVAQGGGVSFTVAATGSSLGYQWFFGETEIPTATSATYMVSGVLPAHDGTYHCVVSNSGGSASSDPAKLIVTQSYAQWIADASLTGADAAITADPDHDGLSNIFEFYHHLDPITTDFAGSLYAAFHFENPVASGDTAVRFAYRTNLRARLAAAGFEKSSALADPWEDVSPSLLETLSTDPATGDPRMRATFPIAPGEIRAFYRLRLNP